MQRDTRQSGQALFLVLVIAVVIMGILGMTLTDVSSFTAENRQASERMRALYIAELGLQGAVRDLNENGDGNLGSENAPIEVDDGAFWVVTTNRGDTTFTCKAFGRINGTTRIVDGLIVETGNIFNQAVFSGNDSDDPVYALEFEGLGVDADEIHGDVYSGGDVVVAEEASVDGQIRAKGVIEGDTGLTGVTQPIPDLAAMCYDEIADVNVADEFAAHQVWQWDDAGGSAWQVPEASGAHIFRKNPNDRNTENNSTVKDDYYLEDPYETVRTDPNWDGTDAYMISVPGAGGAAPVKLVYYVDGNVWVHNIPTYSFKFQSATTGVQVTIVAKGDIILSDNVFYGNNAVDGIAFVAMKDPDVANSGNIYFGDPRGGTIETIYSFLYAENNFHDVNLSASGSKRVILNGTMSAGNKVDIQRTFGLSHSKLVVNYDPRMADGTLSMPGTPSDGRTLEYALVMWRAASENSDIMTVDPGQIPLPTGDVTVRTAWLEDSVFEVWSSSGLSGPTYSQLSQALTSLARVTAHMEAGDPTADSIADLDAAAGKLATAFTRSDFPEEWKEPIGATMQGIRDELAGL